MWKAIKGSCQSGKSNEGFKAEYRCILQWARKEKWTVVTRCSLLWIWIRAWKIEDCCELNDGFHSDFPFWGKISVERMQHCVLAKFSLWDAKRRRRRAKRTSSWPVAYGCWLAVSASGCGERRRNDGRKRKWVDGCIGWLKVDRRECYEAFRRMEGKRVIVGLPLFVANGILAAILADVENSVMFPVDELAKVCIYARKRAGMGKIFFFLCLVGRIVLFTILTSHQRSPVFG